MEPEAEEEEEELAPPRQTRSLGFLSRAKAMLSAKTPPPKPKESKEPDVSKEAPPSTTETKRDLEKSETVAPKEENEAPRQSVTPTPPENTVSEEPEAKTEQKEEAPGKRQTRSRSLGSSSSAKPKPPPKKAKKTQKQARKSKEISKKEPEIEPLETNLPEDKAEEAEKIEQIVEVPASTNEAKVPETEATEAADTKDEAEPPPTAEIAAAPQAESEFVAPQEVDRAVTPPATETNVSQEPAAPKGEKLCPSSPYVLISKEEQQRTEALQVNLVRPLSAEQIEHDSKGDMSAEIEKALAETASEQVQLPQEEIEAAPRTEEEIEAALTQTATQIAPEQELQQTVEHTAPTVTQTEPATVSQEVSEPTKPNLQDPDIAVVFQKPAPAPIVSVRGNTASFLEGIRVLAQQPEHESNVRISVDVTPKDLSVLSAISQAAQHPKAVLKPLSQPQPKAQPIPQPATFVQNLTARQMSCSLSSAVTHKSNDYDLDAIWTENPDAMAKDEHGTILQKKEKPDFYRELFVTRYVQLVPDKEEKELVVDVLGAEDESEFVFPLISAPAKSAPSGMHTAKRIRSIIRNRQALAKPIEEAPQGGETEDEDGDQCLTVDQFVQAARCEIPSQICVVKRVWRVLADYRLAAMAFENHKDEEVFKTNNSAKNVSRFRDALLPAALDGSLAKWAHNTFIEHLPEHFLAAYLELLRALRASTQPLVDSLTAKQSGGAKSELKEIAQEVHNFLSIKPLDWKHIANQFPVPPRPRNTSVPPILVLVPPIAQITGEKLSQKPHEHMYKQLLPHVALCQDVQLRLKGRNCSVTDANNFMINTIRDKVMELKRTYPHTPIFLVGWDTSCVYNCVVGQQLSQNGVVINGIINFAFSNATLQGLRGDVDDDLCSVRTPLLFVVGQFSSSCAIDQLQDLREFIKENSGLIVVGGADSQLRLSSKKLRTEHLTQKTAERAILDLVVEFMDYVFAKPRDLSQNVEKEFTRRRTFTRLLQLRHRLVEERYKEKYKDTIAGYVQAKIADVINAKRKAQDDSPSGPLPKAPRGPKRAAVSAPTSAQRLATAQALTKHVQMQEKLKQEQKQQTVKHRKQSPLPVSQPPQLTPSAPAPQERRPRPTVKIPGAEMGPPTSDHTMCYSPRPPVARVTVGPPGRKQLRPTLPSSRGSMRNYPIVGVGVRAPKPGPSAPTVRGRGGQAFYLVQGQPRPREPNTMRMVRGGKAPSGASQVWQTTSDYVAMARPRTQGAVISFTKSNDAVLSRRQSSNLAPGRPEPLVMPKVNSNRLMMQDQSYYAK